MSLMRDFSQYNRVKISCHVTITVRDLMFLRMQDFDFAQILITFAQISPKFNKLCPTATFRLLGCIWRLSAKGVGRKFSGGGTKKNPEN